MLKEKIKNYSKKLDPTLLNLDKINQIQIKKIGHGAYNINYQIKINNRTYLMRLCPLKDGKERKEYEYKVLKSLEDKEVAPKPFILDTSMKYLPYPFLLEEFFHGKKIKKLSKKLMSEAAELFYKIHLVKNDKFKTNIFDYETYLKNFLHELERYEKKKSIHKDLMEEIKNLVPRLRKYVRIRNSGTFTKSKFKLGLTHRDCKPRHFIQTPEGLRLIDWEFAGIDDNSYHLAQFIYETWHADWLDMKEKYKRVLIDSYLKLDPDPLFKKKVEARTVIRCLSTTFWYLGRLTDWEEEKVSPLLDHKEEKIKRLTEHVKRNLEFLDGVLIF